MTAADRRSIPRRPGVPVPALDPDVGPVVARGRVVDADDWVCWSTRSGPAPSRRRAGGGTSSSAIWDGFTLDNYREVLDPGLTGGMRDGLTNSLAIALPATIIPIGIAAFAAYAFAWIDFRGREVLFIATVSLLAIPLQIALVPLVQLYNSGAHLTIPWLDKTITVFPDLDLYGTTNAVWLSHTAFGLPFAIFLLHNYISSLPRDLFEAARIDGADHFKIFWRLVLPLSVPVLAAFAIFQFLWTWNDYLVSVMMIGVNCRELAVDDHDRQPGRRVRPVRSTSSPPGRSSKRWSRSPCSSCSSASSCAASSPAP